MASQVEQVTYNSPDGATMGATTSDKISFYGVTPIVQETRVTAASTYVVSTSVGIFGLNTADAVTSMVSQISNLIVALKNTGIIA